MILGYLALCWLLGMGAAAFTQGNPWAIAAAALLAAIVPLSTRRAPVAVLWAATAAALLVGGAWLYQVQSSVILESLPEKQKIVSRRSVPERAPDCQSGRAGEPAHRLGASQWTGRPALPGHERAGSSLDRC